MKKIPKSQTKRTRTEKSKNPGKKNRKTMKMSRKIRNPKTMRTKKNRSAIRKSSRLSKTLLENTPVSRGWISRC